MIQGLVSMFLGPNNIRPFIWLINRVGSIVDNRQQELQKNRDLDKRDYVQLLIDAHTQEKLDYNSNQLEFTQVNLVKKLSTDVRWVLSKKRKIDRE